MKICYLILAHDNFSHLDRLIDALDDKDSVFRIHIDKKARQDYFPRHGNAKVIPEHIDVNWGGFSMVEATLALMKHGVEYLPGTDYFILISGVDYPVRPKEFLYKQLEKKKEYMDIAPVPVLFKPVERYEYYYFDYDRRNPKYYNPKFLVEILFKKLRIKRKAPFRIYAGAQWFALTCECVQYILEAAGEDRRYAGFFRHTLVPDEAFFQTIIGNSPFLQNVAASLTYTDWEVAVPPAIIEERHIEFLKDHIGFNDEYGQRFPYFARKFNDDSEKLLEKIRDKLWK
ncbi:MAG: beta-1,6-N-acetylglucosaminyltransferase [Prevotella sp.]|jgi:hypothetical protein|nr:beta-1,6-N-acetylglucosaminyltransferase [Prevotella sp.]